MDDTLIYALKNMGIYDLRNFARSVGVAKPTTLKRQELISAILDIKTGATEPVVGINRGRKPKNRETANELFYKYSNDYIDYTKTVGQLNSEVATNMPRTQFISKGIKTNETTYLKTGNLVLVNNDEQGYYITDTNEKVIVPNLFIKKYNLKRNEEISASCILKNDEFVVLDIMNKESVFEIPFEQLQVLNKTNKIEFKSAIFNEYNSNFSINNGQCVEICYDFKTAPEKVVNTLFESVKSEKLEIFAVLTDEFNNPQTDNNFNNLNKFLVNNNLEEKINNLKQTIQIIKEYVSNAQNCALFIGNLSLIISALKEYYILCGNNESVAKTLALKEIMEILTLARQTQSGSLTIFAINTQNNLEELKPLFNARLNFENSFDGLKLSNNSYSIY